MSGLLMAVLQAAGNEAETEEETQIQQLGLLGPPRPAPPLAHHQPEEDLIQTK